MVRKSSHGGALKRKKSSVGKSSNSSNSNLFDNSDNNTMMIVVGVVLVIIIVYLLMDMCNNRKVGNVRNVRSLEQFGDGFANTVTSLPPANSNEIQVVVFFAPWCGHCKNFQPEWNKLHSVTHDNKVNGKVVKCLAVNGDTSPEISSQYGVQGFPTIKMINGSDVTDYEGSRDKVGILQAVNEL
jgi:thiol-disulfide isomerase/thioredoxin